MTNHGVDEARFARASRRFLELPWGARHAAASRAGLVRDADSRVAIDLRTHLWLTRGLTGDGSDAFVAAVEAADHR